MKNLAIALSLLMASISWVAADAQTCAPIQIEMQSLTNLESIGLLNFTNDFKKFRQQELIETSLCTDALTFTTFSSDVDFVRMARSTVYIDLKVLAQIGSFSALHNPSEELVSKNTELVSSLMGVMTFLSYANADKVTWYKAEGAANIFGNTKPLSDYNSQIAFKMAQEKPLMALGLGVYRALTFNRIAEDKKAYKQETHATPYQIAAALVDNEHFEMARELLFLTQANNYRLMDKTKSPEMTLDMIDKMFDPK